MKSPNWEETRAYVLDLLGRKLPPQLYYHGIHHTRDDVFPAIERLAALARVSDEELLLLRTAAIYHDLGFIEQYTDNEPIAARIAGETLPGFGYAAEQIKTIQELILATTITYAPKNFLEELIRDADLDSLGRNNFFETSHNLWLELFTRGNQISIRDWYEIQFNFLSNHQFHTSVARSLRDATRRQNLEELKQRMTEMDKQAAMPVKHEPAQEPTAKSTDQKTHVLSQLQFLEGVQPQVLEHLLERATEKSFSPGEIILQEGSVGREVLLIVEGLVEAVKHQGGEDVFLAHCGPGQVFGEMGFLEARPRFATIRALEPTRVLELSESIMRAVFAEQPELLFRTTQVLSQRLRESQEQMIADLQNKNRQIAQALEDLQRAQASLVVKERMERELELARNLQESFLPHHFPRLAGARFAARSQSARQVGGDFYDVIPLDNRQVGLVVADVSGKGMPAALYMALTRSLVRAEARRDPSPRQVLLSTHRLLLEIIQTSMFVTIFYGIIDLPIRKMRYARAGHDYPILFTPATRTYRTLNAEGTMLGMFGEAYLEEAETTLEPGDWLILYSDGITDATSPNGEFFGATNLIQVICDSPAKTPQELCDEIFQRVKVFQGEVLPYDDMTLLVASLENKP